MEPPRCKWCGSDNIAWSHETGYIVCMDCGGIQEPILDPGGEVTGPRPSRPLPDVSLGEAERKIMYAASRGLIVRRTRRGLALDRPSNDKARRLLREMRELRAAYRAVLEDPVLKSRTFRSRVGLALYIHLVSQGVPKTRAIMSAASRTGASPFTLQSIVRRYRSRVEDIVARIRDASNRSEGRGEEDTRTDV